MFFKPTRHTSYQRIFQSDVFNPRKRYEGLECESAACCNFILQKITQKKWDLEQNAAACIVVCSVTPADV